MTMRLWEKRSRRRARWPSLREAAGVIARVDDTSRHAFVDRRSAPNLERDARWARTHAQAGTHARTDAFTVVHMAKTPSWKRKDSPIGRRGPRKANPKYKRRSRQPWTTEEVKELKALVRQNTPTGVLSLKLQRPPAAIRSKAQREGISLRPANRSPYSRRRHTGAKARGRAGRRRAA